MGAESALIHSAFPVDNRSEVKMETYTLRHLVDLFYRGYLQSLRRTSYCCTRPEGLDPHFCLRYCEVTKLATHIATTACPPRVGNVFTVTEAEHI